MIGFIFRMKNGTIIGTPNPFIKHNMALDLSRRRLQQDKDIEPLVNKGELKRFSEYFRQFNPERENIVEVTDLIQFEEVSGSDKPMLAQTIFVLLKQAYFNPLSIDRSHSRDDDECLAKITDAVLCTWRPTHLILDGMLVDKSTRIRSERLKTSVTVVWRHSDADSKMDATCSRILADDREKCNAPRLKRFPESADEKEVKFDRSSGTPPTSPFERDELYADHVVILDMSLTLSQMIQKVWNCLEKNGEHKLPSLATFNVDIAPTIACEYEKLCSPRNNVSLPIYASIVIENPNSRLLPHIKREFLANKKVQNSFHITTKYFGKVPDDFMFAQLLALNNKRIELTLMWVISDFNGTAVVVRNENGREFPCANRFAHITIANRYGIPPKYSNDLCLQASLGKSKPRNGIHIVRLPSQSTVNGIFSFHYGY